jgi:hypothetical protein
MEECAHLIAQKVAAERDLENIRPLAPCLALAGSAALFWFSAFAALEHHDCNPALPCPAFGLTLSLPRLTHPLLLSTPFHSICRFCESADYR